MTDYDESSGEARFVIDGLGLGSARAEAVVAVYDDDVASLRMDWFVPEGYAAEVARQDMYGAWLGAIGFALSSALQLAAIVYALLRVKETQFRRGIVLSFIFAALYIWTNFNMLPAVKGSVLGPGAAEAGINGADPGSVTAGVIGSLLVSNLLIVFLAVGMYFSLVAGETLFRKEGAWRPWPEWKDREYGGHVVQSAWRGYGFAFVILGVQSVMKSFIAAVALEEDIAGAQERFICDGTHDKYGLTCWKKGGHGPVTLKEAFAQSCNLVFAELSERIPAEKLEAYGESLGMIGKMGWTGISSLDGEPIRQFPEEEPSRLFRGESLKQDGGALAQTAIGQRDVRLTPLAAAAWARTLLHDGKRTSPRAVSALLFADGRPAERYAPQTAGGGRGLSAGTVEQVKQMMCVE